VVRKRHYVEPQNSFDTIRYPIDKYIDYNCLIQSNFDKLGCSMNPGLVQKSIAQVGKLAYVINYKDRITTRSPEDSQRLYQSCLASPWNTYCTNSSRHVVTINSNFSNIVHPGTSMTIMDFLSRIFIGERIKQVAPYRP
jgi:hypothetical protein